MIENYSELSIGERILFMLNSLKKNQSKVCIEIGISKNAMSNYVNGNRVPDTKTCLKLSKALGVTMEWLLTGEGEMHKSLHPISEKTTKETELIHHYRQLPEPQQIEILTRTKVYSELQQKANEEQKNNAYVEPKQKPIPKSSAIPKNTAVKIAAAADPAPTLPALIEMKVFSLPASAGLGNYLEDESPHDMITYEAAQVPPKADFGIRITGDSMEPLIHDGDIVWVKEKSELDNNEIGIFVVDNEAYCKKLERHPRQKGARLISLNKKYPPIILNQNQVIKTIGKVLQ